VGAMNQDKSKRFLYLGIVLFVFGFILWALGIFLIINYILSDIGVAPTPVTQADLNERILLVRIISIIGSIFCTSGFFLVIYCRLKGRKNQRKGKKILIPKK